MANAYYDFNNASDFTPYVMAGVGVSRSSIEAKASVDYTSDKDAAVTQNFLTQKSKNLTSLAYKVGVGVGKATDVINAVKKAVADGKKQVITVPLTGANSIPHATTGRFGAARLILRPSAPGSGVIAGGATRTVLELAGVKNILSKQLGSNNLLNNARATIEGLSSLRSYNLSNV